LLSTWIATPFHDFVDLCSVANVSMFILDEALHGFYIHGKSPTGNADVSMDELRKTLEREIEGKARRRGIPEAESDL
jgi:meckelin